MISKLPNVGTTIFTVMSKMAVDHGAVNLSQGFPNFPVDPRLVEILKEQSELNVHQYAPMAGLPSFLEIIGNKIEISYGRILNSQDEILVCAGATQAIFTSIQAMIFRDDEVIVLDPSYDCYAPAIELAGGKPIHVSLNEEFMPDWDKIADVANEKTKMIIINNPHNPSGRVWKKEDFKALESIMDCHPELILLSDEVYEYITFEQGHISINSIPALQDRSIIVSSFGKTFHITGWKLGYLVANVRLMNEIKKVHQFNVFCVSSIEQHVLSQYLYESKLGDLGTFYQEKRDFFRSLLENSKFDLLPCEGTYFQLAGYSEISSLDDVAFCEQLVKEHGVAAIPVSVFNQSKKDQKVIRFCFAKTEETLIQAANLLCKI